MKSATQRCLEAIDQGKETVKEIAIYAGLDERLASSNLWRLQKRNLVERLPARYRRKQ